MILPNRHDLGGGEANPPWPPYRSVMRSVASACGAPIVDLPAVFRADGRAHLFLDEMHPSPVGHKLMADAISKTLTDRGWPDRPIQVRAPAPITDIPADPFEGKGNQLELFGG